MIVNNLIPSHTDEPIDSDDDGSSIHGGMVDAFNLLESDDENLIIEDDIFEVVDHPSESDFDIEEEEEDCSDTSIDLDKSEDDEKGANGVETGKDPEDEEGDSDSEEDVECTMQDIFQNKPNKEANRHHPPNIKTDGPVVDTCFHPDREILAVAKIDGECFIYRYTDDSVEEIKRLEHHGEACRQAGFGDDGTLFYTVSKDKSLAVVDVETFTIKNHMKDAHEASIYSFFPVNNNICATGDDDGMVKIWDLRKGKSVFEFRCGEETVSSMVVCSDNKYLAAAVMDGSLTGLNLRSNRLEAQSELFDTEFVSLCLIKEDSKLLVGSSTGTIYIFNWGSFGLNIDAMKGHPMQVSSIVPITDSVVVTGCEDGSIRTCNVYPHRFDGVVGQHDGDAGIENLSISHDGKFLASCAMDTIVHFWNIEYLYKRKMVRYKRGGNLKRAGKNRAFRNLESSRKRGKNDFYLDLNNTPDDETNQEMGPVAGTSYDSDKD